jgi:hypothetical protein
MGDWFKRRLHALEGNVVYAAIAALGVYLLTLLPAKLIIEWLHRPITNLGMLLWPLLPVGILAAFMFIHKYATPQMNIRVHPTSGPSTTVFLKLTNSGRDSTFSAFGEIVGHPNGVNDFRRGEFQFGWDDGILARRLIHRNETASIVIASFDLVDKYLSELKVWEVSGPACVPWESFRWNVDPKETLPAFELRIRIVAEKTQSPKTFNFTVKPKAYMGPLELTEKAVPS